MKKLFAILSWSLLNIWKIISILLGIIFLYILISIALPIMNFFQFFAELPSTFEIIINDFFEGFNKYKWFRNNNESEEDHA